MTRPAPQATVHPTRSFVEGERPPRRWRHRRGNFSGFQRAPYSRASPASSPGWLKPDARPVWRFSETGRLLVPGTPGNVQCVPPPLIVCRCRGRQRKRLQSRDAHLTGTAIPGGLGVFSCAGSINQAQSPRGKTAAMQAGLDRLTGRKFSLGVAGAKIRFTFHSPPHNKGLKDVQRH